MAEWNRNRRPDFGDDFERNDRNSRQSEQFENNRSWRGDDYEAGYGQMGEDRSRSAYGDQYGESRGRDERYGNSWRGGESGSQGSDRAYSSDQSTGFGAARYTNRERGGFGSFTSDGYRTGGMSGPREHLGYGRGEDYRGGYSGGSYGAGTYGAAPRREYSRGDYSSDRGNHQRGFFDRAGDEVASWFGDEEAARRREMDHRGRGPANYTRSDERILEDACDQLTQDWDVDARNVQVSVQNGEVTLDGTVENRRQKRRAEDVVHEISGVNHVQNNLRTQETTRRDDDSVTDRNPGTLA